MVFMVNLHPNKKLVKYRNSLTRLQARNIISSAKNKKFTKNVDVATAAVSGSGRSLTKTDTISKVEKYQHDI